MPLFRRLFGKGRRLDGGQRIEQVVRYANSTQGGWFSGLDVLDTAQEKTRTRAYWEWRAAHQPIVLADIDVARNGGTAKVFDLVAEEARDAEKALKDKFGTALYTQQAGDQMESLVDGTDDGSNVATYGNINRSTYTWWQGYYNGVGGALSLTMMATAYEDVMSGTDVPSLITCHKSEWSSYEALLQPAIRYQFTSGGYPKIDGGFQVMLFRGTPVLADEYCTDGYMYLLNEKYWEVLTMKHPRYPTDKMGFTTTKMREPTDQAGTVAFILWFGNLVNNQPRRSGVIRAIT